MTEIRTIVSLLPSATELLARLGLMDRVVAVSHECDVPSAASTLPKATASTIPSGQSQAEINAQVSEAVKAGRPLYRVDVELLHEVQPDLIVTQGLCDVCAVTPETIQADLRGTRCTLPATTQILALQGATFASICEDLRTLAALTDRREQAELRIVEAERRWRDTPTRGGGGRLLLLEWIDPPFSPGHWVPEQIAAAGFDSAIGRSGAHSRALSWSEIEAAKPDALGVVCCGYDLAANRRWAEELIASGHLEPWFTGPVVAFDANRYFSRPTLAIVEGAELLRQAFVEERLAGPGFQRVQSAR